ncbi:hypothetical protein OC846_004383 [Tilletia horrida]|uniref:Uncharacterized protein n=1 Tax=Tilletia horrida TaxID=155126 RepID=A0AAN6GQW8_9BASI|nr:hypothetical protein OC845_003926 [Tilletia horrida]KAK0548695.1 hypothetical protein OC846_004383 [Tilletia horrida]KAK0566934.1 hypothetical protein OC861_002977 [Tilletia horrida]
MSGHHHHHQYQPPTAITTDMPAELTEEIDPNMVSPWGTYHHDVSSATPLPQQQHLHHHHHAHGSASYEARGFQDVQLTQQQLHQQEQQQHHQQDPIPAHSLEDDRSALYNQLNSSSTAMPGVTLAQVGRKNTNGSSQSAPFLAKTGRAHSSRTGSLDFDLETEKAMIRQRQSQLGMGGAGPSMLGASASGAGGGGGGAHGQGMLRELSDFDIANGRIGKRLLANKSHIAAHGDQFPITWGHLFKRPLIRQWLHNGRLYREEDEREPSRFELFFDLSFVGIVHLLADGAAESATAINVAKFFLTFHPAWSIWLDVRQFINTSGTDDVWQRAWILLMMVLLAGYAANATGIKIENFGLAAHAAQLAGELPAEGGGGGGEGSGSLASEILGSMLGEASGAGGEGTTAGGHGEGATKAGEHARRLLVNHVGPWLLKRAAAEGGGHGGSSGAEGGGGESELPPLSNYIGNGYYFGEHYDSALRCAIAFFLVAKCVRLLLYLIYGALLPKFRKALWLNGLALGLIAAINIPLIFVTTPWLIILLWTAGIAVEIFSRYFIALGLQIMHARQKHKGQTSYIPAASIEHIMERMVLFTILIIGESILVSNYSATPGLFGISHEFGRSALAITLSFLICWLFFDADAARVFVHALRRNWFTSISFTNLHLPLCASLILMASAMHVLVTQETADQGYLWYFSGSLATTVLCIAGIGLLHHSLDLHGSAKFPHHVRIIWRLVAAVIIACMPLRTGWTSLSFLAVNVGILAWLVAFETIGKVGAVGKHYDEKKAAELKAAREALYASEKAGRAPRESSAGLDDSFGGAKGSAGASSFSMGPINNNNKNNRDVEAVDSTGTMYVAATQQEGATFRDKLFYRMRRLNKDWTVRAPRRADWHEYEDLTGAERGEEDVGIESELGKLQVKEVSSGQRWAYAV